MMLNTAAGGGNTGLINCAWAALLVASQPHLLPVKQGEGLWHDLR
jgi:hypothetical protein